MKGRHYSYHRTTLSTVQIWGWEKGSGEDEIGLWSIRLTTLMISAPSEGENVGNWVAEAGLAFGEEEEEEMEDQYPGSEGGMDT